MDFDALAAQCAPSVAPQTMAAIVRTESRFQPLAIGINGGARLVRQPANKPEAVATANWLIANGYNIDLGLGQINSNNLKWLNLSVDDAFDPCRNLAASATILSGNYRTARSKTNGDQAALHAALSAYNTGSFTRGFTNGYVQKVLNNANGKGQGRATPIPLLPSKRLAPKSRKKAAPVVASTSANWFMEVADMEARPPSSPSDHMIFQ